VEFLADAKPVKSLEQGTVRYPEAARARRVEDVVELEYVVGPTGETRSIRPLKRTYREFLAAAVAAVRENRFKPAEAGGCRVSVVVNQRVSFSVR